MSWYYTKGLTEHFPTIFLFLSFVGEWRFIAPSKRRVARHENSEKEPRLRAGERSTSVNMSASVRAVLTAVCIITVLHLAAALDNSGFDHRAHAVPGPDQTVFDLDDNGSEMVQLDGVGSHSHYFNAGPPVISGVINQFTWRITSTNRVFCTAMKCEYTFPVGTTKLSLTVVDNTQDTAMDTMTVTVLPRSAASERPRIDSVSPSQGQAIGGNTVTINGAFLYRDSRVFFGLEEARDVIHNNINQITCKAPGGTGTTPVMVESSIGTSNEVQYTFQNGAKEVPIRFLFDTWKNVDGSEYIIEEITSITLGRDHRYYMGSLTGYVTAAYVDRSLTVRTSCTGAFMGKDRSVTGIGYNPLDPYNRVLVTTNTHFYANKGQRWDNAKVEAVDIGADDCPIRGPTIISGLVTSNHDHGTNAIAFLPDGQLLVTVGSFSNAGASTAEDGIGGVPENPLSGSIVIANYLAPGFDGAVKYDQYDNPATSAVVSGDVETYVVGVRNSFGIVTHSNGRAYATDNGPNTNFGASSVSCTENGPDPESDDKLLHLVRGNYYGHPNRNRGRLDPRQCVYRSPGERSGNGYTKPIGTMTSSTNGIIEYRANTFKGALKEDLLMSKVAFGASGLVWRAELNADGTSLREQPYQFFEQSGVSLTMGLYGELVMPQLKKYRVIALRPDEDGASKVSIIAIHPARGPKKGGAEVFITGHFLNSPGLEISFDGKPCTSFADIQYQHIRCITPRGSGKVSVVATAEGQSSVSYGHEYEYL